MDFLNTSFLWGLPLVAVPLVIHLLHRRRLDVVHWGAMQFLVEAVTRRRRRWRLEDLLLLLMRAAMVAIVLFALAQPRIRASWFGAGGPRDVVLVVDNSLSTSAGQPGREGSIFDAVLRRAEHVIGDLNESDYVRILLASTQEWLDVDPVKATGTAKRQLVGRVRQLHPTLGAADMMQSVRRAIDAESAAAQAPRAIIVLTDGQAYGWHAEAVGSWRSLQRQASAAGASLHVATVGGEDVGITNISLDGLSATRTVVGVGERLSISAIIRNTGVRPGPVGLVKLLRGADELASSSIPALAVGQTTTAKFTPVFDKPGVFALRAEIAARDDLPLDNAAQLAVEVVEQIPILLVESVHDPQPLSSDAGYLAAALGQYTGGPAAGNRGVFRPKIITAAELTPETLRGMRCVVLANVAGLQASAIAALRDAVREGMGLWVVLGDRTEPALLNETFTADGQPLLPLAVAEPVGNPDNREQFERIPPPPANHPATHLLADTQRLDINQARIYRRHRLIPAGTAANAGQHVVSLLTTDRGEPLAAEKLFGRGRVVLQGVSMDARWSNLPVCQSFVVMVHEWLWYLVDPGQTQWNINPGEALNVSLPAKDTNTSAEVTMPSGARVKIESSDRPAGRVFAFARTSLPGTYELAVSDPGGKPHVLPWVVRRDPAESYLTRLSEGDRQMLASAGDLKFEDEGKALARTAAAVARPQPLWSWILLALLGLLLFELLLAGRLTRRRLDQYSRADQGQTVAQVGRMVQSRSV